jgi:hypothetical protein
MSERTTERTSECEMVINIYNNESWNTYVDSGDFSYVSKKDNFIHPPGTLVYFVNIESKVLVGVGMVSTWEDGKVTRDTTLFPEYTRYTKELEKHNRYAIAMTKVRILPKPTPLSDLADFLGIDPKTPNNIVKGCQSSFSRAYYDSKRNPEINAVVREKFRTFLKTLLFVLE